MNDFLLLTTVVIFFATVQSLFGVGLLVFGTPTLLLLGYPFESTLALLLPSSLVISAMQIFAGNDRIKYFKKMFLVYSVPFIIIGLGLVLTEVLIFDIKFAVGLMLVLTASLRYVDKIQSWVARILKKRLRFYLMFMGFVHGLSSMGGGLLTVLITSIYDAKETVRANIAYGYLVFALSQILVVAILHPMAFTIESVIFAAISFVTYYTAGNAIFLKSSKRAYPHMITVFILAYGVILIGQRFL